MVGELKNPLLNKNIIIPIIGPMPNMNNINLAEFFVCPNSLESFFINFRGFFFDDFFFMKTILQQTNSEIINNLSFN
tara:strand:- start:287 stop:517 length:231 start_codon:yes stop_codon:yes gene_type:complete